MLWNLHGEDAESNPRSGGSRFGGCEEQRGRHKAACAMKLSKAAELVETKEPGNLDLTHFPEQSLATVEDQ